MKTVVLHSGGLDSTVLLAMMVSVGKDVIPVNVNYGQRHYALEHASSQNVCRAYGLEPVELEIPKSMFHPNALSGHVPVPEGHYEHESMKATVCPNRNMVLLACATAQAIALDAQEVAYAAHAGDHAIYPDCRPEFVDAMERVLRVCHYHPIWLLTPFLHMTKAEIVLAGRRFGAPMEKTYSCYNGRALHCGKCGTCVERREAFTVAGILDPTAYEE